MYNVVFKNISGSNSDGVITRSSFKDKQEFDVWYNKKMQGWYQIVEQGVAQERAVELCSTPAATQAIVTSKLRDISDLVTRHL